VHEYDAHCANDVRSAKHGTHAERHRHATVSRPIDEPDTDAGPDLRDADHVTVIPATRFQQQRTCRPDDTLTAAADLLVSRR
jgi:hypothetical protein